MPLQELTSTWAAQVNASVRKGRGFGRQSPPPIEEMLFQRHRGSLGADSPDILAISPCAIQPEILHRDTEFIAGADPLPACYRPPIGAYAVMVAPDSDRRLVLEQRENGYLNLPGGIQRKDTSMAQSLFEAVLRKTGLPLNQDKIARMGYFYLGRSGNSFEVYAYPMDPDESQQLAGTGRTNTGYTVHLTPVEEVIELLEKYARSISVSEEFPKSVRKVSAYNMILLG